MSDASPLSISERSISLERDGFLRRLLHHLAGALQDTIGLDDASGLISIVGQEMGQEISEEYRAALSADRLSTEQIAEVLVDLKRRIQGDFYVISLSDEKIVLGNRACPFGDQVVDRPALCMMTSNVFGSIAARETGYAKVDLQETIANGDAECRVVVYLKKSKDADAAPGRAYFRGGGS